VETLIYAIYSLSLFANEVVAAMENLRKACACSKRELSSKWSYNFARNLTYTPNSVFKRIEVLTLLKATCILTLF